MDYLIIMYRKDAIITRFTIRSTNCSSIFSNKDLFPVFNVIFFIPISPFVTLFDYIYDCRCDKVTIFFNK